MEDSLPEITLRQIFRLIQDDELDIVCLQLTCKRFNRVVQRMRLFSTYPMPLVFTIPDEPTLISAVTESTALSMLIKKELEADQQQLNLSQFLRTSSGRRHMTQQASASSTTTSTSRPAPWTLCEAFTYKSAPQVVDTFLYTSFSQPDEDTLPVTLTSLTFSERYNKDLIPGTLPISLTSLTFGDMFNKPLIPGTLPPALKSLAFGCVYDKPIAPDILPSSLTSLKFGYYFNKDITLGSLPESLATLVFGSCFNRVVTPGTLPSSITTLIFGHSFGRAQTNPTIELRSLPDSLTTLEFGYMFNQPLQPMMLPGRIRTLIFGHKYNRPLTSGVLPASLYELTLGFDYDQPVSQVAFPSMLTSLIVKHIGQRRYLECQPHAIERLCIMRQIIAFDPASTDNVTPPSLIEVTVTSHVLYIDTPDKMTEMLRRLLRMFPGVPTYVLFIQDTLYRSLMKLKYRVDREQHMAVSTLRHLLMPDIFFDIVNMDLSAATVAMTASSSSTTITTKTTKSSRSKQKGSMADSVTRTKHKPRLGFISLFGKKKKSRVQPPLQ
ncbi:hypothetical protein SAMD00019534_082480, partial [Acytostelium subglobosum LB1]|uniref:hypothetical protein n=1 Tax=Acytostelium subglobosum LB1 TaxID=1410327 RepID=UPI00064513CD